MDPRILGPYLLEAEVGRGGGGIVYRGRHRRTGAVAAVKVATADGEDVRREMHVLSRLRHPGVVRVLQRGLGRREPWMAMELVPGRTLAERAGDGELRLGERLTLVRRLCPALAYLHGEGIVHRDLKPRNVVIRPDDRPVIIDFGLARRARPSREKLAAAERSGTPAFMAPEQLAGEVVDARADLFALGAILYLLLTGRTPFASLDQLLDPALRPAPPSELAPELPAPLDGLLLALLEKEPRARMGHASDVDDALRRLGASNGHAGPRPRPFLYRPGFAGRGELLELLTTRVAGALARREGELSWLAGESGIGKTRFLLELARRAASRGARVVHAVGDAPLDHGGTRAGGAAGTTPPQAVLLAAAARVREIGAPDPGAAVRGSELHRVLCERAAVLSALLPSLVDLVPGSHHAEPPPLPPAAARLRLLTALLDTLVAFAQVQPVLLLLDDLQWADDLSIAFLEMLIRSGRLERSPLYVVAAYRSDEAQPSLRALAEAEGARRIALAGLGAGAVRAIAADMLAAEPPQQLVEELERQSRGNPFVVAESLRAAVAAGTLVRGELSSCRRLGLPGSVRALVARRLDALSPEAARVASVASVLGRVVDAALLRATLSTSEGALLLGVQELVNRQVLEPRDDGSLAFVHDRLRDAAYARLAAIERRAWHRAAAGALSRRAPASTGDVAMHWLLAGRASRARPLFLAAAREARRRYAHEEAARLYRHHLACTPLPTPGSVAARIELGSDLELHGRVDEAAAELRRAAREARIVARPRLLARSNLALMGLRIMQGRAPEATALARRALAICRRAGDAGGEARALSGIGLLAAMRRDVAAAERAYADALGIQRRLGDRQGGAVTLAQLAGLHRESGRTSDARPLYEQALATHRAVGDRQGEGIALGNLAIIEAEEGRSEQALHLYERALAIHREVGNRRNEGIALGNLGLIHYNMGRLQRGGALYEEAIVIHREVGNRRALSTTLSNLGHVRHLQEDAEGALALYAQAIRVAREIGDLRQEVTALTDSATIRSNLGDASARDDLQRAAELAKQTGMRRSEARALKQLATVARRQEDLAHAEDLLARARRIYEELGHRLDVALSACQAGHLALARGGSAEAEMAEARLVAGELGEPDEGLLGREIRRLARAIDARAAGLTLVGGEHPDDVGRG